MVRALSHAWTPTYIRMYIDRRSKLFVLVVVVTERCRNVALDILQVLVQYSPKPLSNTLVETAFPAACHCILNSEDNETLQSGGEVIRIYLAVAARQVTVHRDNDGQTGLQYILQIVAQLLNPQVI